MDSQTHASIQSGQPPSRKRAIRPGTKFASVLKTLLDRGPSGMNCFEAVRWCHDYTLRSSIAKLKSCYGFTFARKDESVPGHMGSTVYCTRYSLTPEDRELAKALLGGDEL